MKSKIILSLIVVASIFNFSCSNQNDESAEITAAEILGNPNYLAMSYGGYRHFTRDTVPTVKELKEDLAILAALDVKLIRTYNSQQFLQAANLLQAISELKEENAAFEMYVMIGAWIDCEGAWGDSPNHEAGSVENNTKEIEAAVKMAVAYPDIVKIIAVGNEAMVNWAASYYVKPNIILKWVNYLQGLKETQELPANVWITSSDNFASWGGGEDSYHTEDLNALIAAVDYVSAHTYPFHDSHYNPAYWSVPADEETISDHEKIDSVMLRAKRYAISQYQGVVDYMASLGIDKPVHIGETGWASVCGFLYGANGSQAADEYKQKLYYDHMRKWSNETGVSCFFFEAFDEKWKDQSSGLGSENHFGLINLDGEAKYALWDKVDAGVFDGLSRGGNTITKTYNGNDTILMVTVAPPPLSKKVEESVSEE